MASSFPAMDHGLVERIEAATATMPVRRKKMFGTSSWFMESNDQMFSGVWGDGLMVRVGADERLKLIESGEAVAFDPMGGRPMKEYVLVDIEAIAEDGDLLAWLERGAEFASTLAPKAQKVKRQA